MHKSLYNFLEDNNILYNKQFGFRKNNSTMDALIKIIEKINESIDKGKYGCGIFIDLRKAFTQLIMILCYSKWNIMERDISPMV